MPKFTLADVQRLIGDMNIKATENKDGVRIEASPHSWELDLVADVMRIALALSLEPSQIRSNDIDLHDYCGDYADPYMDIDVTFLWEPHK